MIRPLVICIFLHEDRILVQEGYDPHKDQHFYRPLGGGIEFGERSHDAIRREIREEIGAAITDVRLLGTLENIFVCDGIPGHEIVMVYDAAFMDSSLYTRPQITGAEDNGLPISAVWRPLASFTAGSPPLYPDDLLDLIHRQDSGQG